MSVQSRLATRSSKSVRVWSVDIKFVGADGSKQRVRRDSPVNTKRGAEQLERQLRTSLLDGSYQKQQEEKPLTLGGFVGEFLTYSRNNNKHSSVVTKEQVLEDHIVPYFGDTLLRDIGQSAIEAFKQHMKAKNSGSRAYKVGATKAAVEKRYGVGPKLLSLKSVNNVLAILGKLLGLAEEYGKLLKVPKMALFKVERPKFDYLGFDEAERLLESADPEWRTLLLVAMKTGLRQGELIGLRWSDVDLVRGKLDVRKTIWKGVEGLPKGGRERTVDLPGSVVQALKQHRSQTKLKSLFVFCQEDGKPLTPGQMKWPLLRALKRAGISRDAGQIGWHDLRHTYGSHLAMKGVPLKAIQELMGHATIEMTMRYAHLSPETKRDAVQLLDTPAPVSVAL